MEPVLPDYSGASICNLVPAVLAGREASWLPEPARGADTTVVLVLDGLGWTALREHHADLPVLSGMVGGAITAVAPATTAAGLTSLTTGLPPAGHGMVGYRIRLDGQVLNTLAWRVDRGVPPDPFDVQRHTAFLGREVPVVTKSEFRDSGFTRAHMRGARHLGWSTTSVLVEHVRRLAGAREPFVYAYYPGVDTVAHEFGLRDDYFRSELRAADALVGRLLATLPERAALVVTADHGQVHLEPDSWLDLGDVAGLVEVAAGDGRFRHLYAFEGARGELLAGAREQLGGVAWVRSRREVLDEEWLGPDARGSVPGRIGDVVLAAREAVAFVDPAVPSETRLRSGHGSLTAEEMLVPLLAARGSARDG